MKRLNGWQRIWVVLTILAAVWFLVVFPLRSFSLSGNAAYAAAQKADYDSGRCQSYIEQPLGRLTEPPYATEGGTCWFIFTTRKVHGIDDIPFTRDKAASHDRWQTVKGLGDVLLVALVGLALTSGGAYGFGWVVAWVRRGFRHET